MLELDRKRGGDGREPAKPAYIARVISISLSPADIHGSPCRGALKVQPQDLKRVPFGNGTHMALIFNPDFALDPGCGAASFSSESAGSTPSSDVEPFTIACSRKDRRSAPPANAIAGFKAFIAYATFVSLWA